MAVITENLTCSEQLGPVTYLHMKLRKPQVEERKSECLSLSGPESRFVWKRCLARARPRSRRLGKKAAKSLKQCTRRHWQSSCGDGGCRHRHGSRRCPHRCNKTSESTLRVCPAINEVGRARLTSTRRVRIPCTDKSDRSDIHDDGRHDPYHHLSEQKHQLLRRSHLSTSRPVRSPCCTIPECFIKRY